MSININSANISSIQLVEQGSNPATPAAGKRKIYVKSSGLYLIDDAGNAMQITPDVLGTANQIMKVNAAATGVEWATLGKARYSSNTGTAIATGSAAIVDFEDLEYDTDSAVTTGVGWKYTAPATGYYRVSFCIFFQSNGAWAANERVFAAITVNTVDTYRLARWEAHATNALLIAALNGSTTIPLTAGQYISLTVNQNSGSNLSLDTDPKNCWISIDRVA